MINPLLLRQLRTKLNLSQEQLASQLQVSFATVNRWEGGRAQPQKAQLEALERLLEEAGLFVPKTHDCIKLLGLLPPAASSLGRFRRGLNSLSRYAVFTRYIDARTTSRKAMAALRWATKVRDACRELLGVRPKRPQRP